MALVDAVIISCKKVIFSVCIVSLTFHTLKLDVLLPEPFSAVQ